MREIIPRGIKRKWKDGKEIYFLLNSVHNLFEVVCLRGGKRKSEKAEIRAHWLLMARDEVELFNLQIALTLCASIVLWLNSNRQFSCAC